MIGQISAPCRSATSFEPVCDQLRTSFEPDSVMEFGLKSRWSWVVSTVQLCYIHCKSRTKKVSAVQRDDFLFSASFVSQDILHPFVLICANLDRESRRISFLRLFVRQCRYGEKQYSSPTVAGKGVPHFLQWKYCSPCNVLSTVEAKMSYLYYIHLYSPRG